MKHPTKIGNGLLILVWVLAGSVMDSGEDILARIELATNRRRASIPEYTAARHYTLQNRRFGKEAAAFVRIDYRQSVGERYTVLNRSGSEKLGGIIDKLIAFESSASTPSERARHQIAPANYHAHLLGSEMLAGRNCYILQLTPKIKAQYLITGKAWIDSESYAVVRIDGQVASSISPFVGTPRITEDFVEVRGFWFPDRVHSVASSFLLGSTELNIRFWDYQFTP